MRVSLFPKTLLAAGFLLHCSPDFDKLNSGAVGGSGTGGSSSDGGLMTAEGGSTTALGGKNSGGKSSGGTAGGAGDTSQGGEDPVFGGAAGSPNGGTTTAEGGRSQGGKSTSGGKSSAGGTTGQQGGNTGAGGAPDPSIPPPSTTCQDGCLNLYVPFTATGQQQFFTILTGDVDLSQSIVTAKVRVVSFKSTAGFMKLYASSIDNFDYYGGPGLEQIHEGDEKSLTLDLTGTPKNLSGNDWNNKHVLHLGIQINSQPGTMFGPLHLELEEITLSDNALPPFDFKTAADVTDMYVNDYQPVPGSAIRWVAPVAQGGAGGAGGGSGGDGGAVGAGGAGGENVVSGGGSGGAD